MVNAAAALVVSATSWAEPRPAKAAVVMAPILVPNPLTAAVVRAAIWLELSALTWLVVSTEASADVIPTNSFVVRADMFPAAIAVTLFVPRAANCAELSAASCDVVSELIVAVPNAAIVLVGRPAIADGERLVKAAIT